MKQIIIILIFIPVMNGFCQLNNGGFEIWDTTFTATYESELIGVFGVANPSGGEAQGWAPGSPFGVCRTTDSYSGNYSIIIHNWYTYVQEWITYHDSLSYRPTYLQGYFKYITGGTDGISVGGAGVALSKFNGTSTDTIATGNFTFDSTTVFTPFQITLNYISGANPDSIKIYFINGNSNCMTNNICNLLYLDDLSLSDSQVGIENEISNNGLKMFPNPFSDFATIQFDKYLQGASIKISDLSGRVLLRLENISGNSFVLQRELLNEGLYMLEVLDGNGTVGIKKIAIDNR